MSFVDELRGHFNTPKNLQRVCEVMEDRLKNRHQRGSEGLRRGACHHAYKQKLAAGLHYPTGSWPKCSGCDQGVYHKARWQGDLQWDYYRGTTELPVLVRGSPPWLAWLDYRRVHGQRIDFMKTRERWTVPTIWPPGYERHKQEYITRAKEADR